MASARSISFTLGLALAASRAVAQTPAPEPTLTPVQVAVACAPSAVLGVVPIDAPRVMGNQDTVIRSLFGDPGQLVISAGSDRGVQLNQRYFVRRVYRGAETQHDKLPHLVMTTGWVRITAVNKLMSLAVAEHACADILQGDFLEAFYAPNVTDDIFATDTTGELDFESHSRVLYGPLERNSAGAGEYMLIDRGTKKNVAIGSRFAIYRDRAVTGLPLTPIAEASAIAVGPSLSVVRITHARDAVFSKDVAIPRGPSKTPKADVEALLPENVTVAPALSESSPMMAGVMGAIQELSEYRRLIADNSKKEAQPHLKAAANIINKLPRPKLEVVQGEPVEVWAKSGIDPKALASTDVHWLVQNAMRELMEYASLMTDNAPRAADERLTAARQTVDQLQHLPR